MLESKYLGEMKSEKRKTLSILLVVVLYCVLVPSVSWGQKNNNKTIIKGRFHGNYIHEDVQLILYKDLLLPSTKQIQQSLLLKGTVDPDGMFSFDIPEIDSVTYFSLGQGLFNGKVIPILDLYQIANRDSIFLDVKCLPDNLFSEKFSDSGNPKYKYDIIFSGVGYNKMQARFKLDTMKRGIIEGVLNNIPREKRNGLAVSEGMLDVQLRYLENHRSDLSNQSFYWLKLKTLSEALMNMRNNLRIAKEDQLGKVIYKNTIDLLKEIPVEELETSPFFNQMVLKATLGDSVLNCKNPLEFLPIETVKICDRVIAGNILENWKELSTNDTLRYTYLLGRIESKNIREIIEQLFLDRKVDLLGDFILTDTNGREVSLSKFKGKAVFLDFYFTGCGNCIAYFKKTVSHVEEHFANNPDVVFIAISIDGNQEKWLNSVRSGSYSSKQSVNLYTSGMGAEHPMVKNLNIRGYPSPLLINRKGKVVNSSYKELGQYGPTALIKLIEKELR